MQVKKILSTLMEDSVAAESLLSRRNLVTQEVTASRQTVLCVMSPSIHACSAPSLTETHPHMEDT